MLTLASTKEKPVYICAYCHKHYTRELFYIKHECKHMVRQREFKSPETQAAWNFYQEWMRVRKFACPSATTFMDSRLYGQFIKFVRFAKSVQLPLPDKFISLMVLKKRTPELWTHDQVYSEYMEYMDVGVTPIEQVMASADTLLQYAERHNIDVGEVFEYIQPNEIIHLVRLRKLSAWLLLYSIKFVEMHSKLGAEQQLTLENLIRYDTWAENKKKHSGDIDTIKRVVHELGL
jgi:hypothetical protein